MGATSVVALSLLAAAPAAVAAGGSRPVRGATAGAPSMTMVSQTPYVKGSGTFRSQLQVSTIDPSSNTLTVTVYPRLTSRTAFDQAASGRLRGAPIYRSTPRRVASLPTDATGGVDIDVDVDPPAATPGAFAARSGSAVYPVTYQLSTRAGIPLGPALATFLVYSAGTSADLPRLLVSLTVAISGPTGTGPVVTALPAAAAAGIGAEASVLAAHAGVPVTLEVDPGTVDRLEAGPAADRSTVSTLATAVGSGPDQLQSASYLPVSVAALVSAGLGDELARQYQAGAATLTSQLRRSPDGTSAVVATGLDTTTLSSVQAGGVDRLVVPDADLSPLPAAQRQTTYARPSVLGGRSAGATEVYAADAGLSAMLVAGGDRVLDGEHLLAGLAMVQLEAPARTRGVSLVAPAGAAIDPTVLGTVLGGLRGDPFASAVTVDGLFGAVPVDSPPVTRSLVPVRATPPLSEPAAVRTARQEVQGLGATLPGAARTIAPLQRQLLVATSSAIDEVSRRALLGSIGATVRHAEAAISLPGSSSVTLTARRGTIPLTVLSNPSLDARVQLRISSQKLEFRPFTPPGGRCVVGPSSTETCQMVLTSEATTLRVPVESRTSGIFTMEVTLASADGSVTLATNRDIVRSTAFSGVGVVLIVVAGLGLAGWWVRNIRHGRRARQLVDPSHVVDLTTNTGPIGATASPQERPRPAATEGDRGSGPVPPAGRPERGAGPTAPLGPVEAMPPFPNGDAFERPGAPPTAWLDDDPLIAQFFATPPPEFGHPGVADEQVSPSGHRTGPKP